MVQNVIVTTPAGKSYPALFVMEASDPSIATVYTVAYGYHNIPRRWAKPDEERAVRSRFADWERPATDEGVEA